MKTLSKTAKIPVTIDEDNKDIRDIKYKLLREGFHEAMIQGNLALRCYDAMQLSITPQEFKEDTTTVSHRTRVDRILAENREYLSGSQTAGISGAAEVLYKSTSKDVYIGKKSRPTYRNTEQPIPIKSRGSKIIPIDDSNPRQYTLKLNGFIQNWLTDKKIQMAIDDINEYRTEKAKSQKITPELITISPSDISKTQRGLMFRTVFSYKDDGHNELTNRIALDTYKLCDSKLVRDGKKNNLFFMATYKIECEQLILDTNKVCGIDLGIKYPVVCATNFNRGRIYLGSSDEIKHMRSKFGAVRRRKQYAIGVKSKSNRYEQSQKEKNWYKTKCHQITRGIIKFALANGCGVIHMEDTTVLGKLKREHGTDEYNKLWTPFMIFTMLEYKCKENGIKLIRVNPRNTSRRCSKCGYISKDNRKTQSGFVCLECGKKLNADYNAAINIACMDENNIKNGYLDILKEAV